MCVSFTCILSKLVHRLQINDVRRELAVHLPQHHASPGVPLQHILNMVANRCAVRSPTTVLVQPLPDYHPGHVLRGVPQPVDGHQQPRSRSSHQSDRLEPLLWRQTGKLFSKRSLDQRLVQWSLPSAAALTRAALRESLSTGDRLPELRSAVKKVSRRPVRPVRRGGRWR